MRIVIPENIGGELVVIPSDSYEAEIQDVFVGESATKNPKCTVKYIVTSEYTGKKGKDTPSTVGAVILETFSLLSQAIWRLNDLWKDVKGESLPQGDYSKEEMETMLKDGLIGQQFTLLVDTKDNPTSGDPMNEVVQRTLLQRGKRKAKR